MSIANIKLPTELISKLKASTNQITEQKAVEVAIKEYLKFKGKMSLVQNLHKINFKKNFKPLKLRKNECGNLK